MKTTDARIQFLATLVVALLLVLQGSAAANNRPPHCCQMSGPSCSETFHPDVCEKAGGQVRGNTTCDSTSGLCGDMPVCCSEAEGPCTEVTADQCADTGGTSVLGDLCDAKGACRECKPEGAACPTGSVLVDLGGVKVNLGDVYNPGACCAGTGTCTLLGIAGVPCDLALVSPVFTCTCNAVPPYGYADAASLGAPPSNSLAMLYGAGAFGLLLPIRRRRRRK